MIYMYVYRPKWGGGATKDISLYSRALMQMHRETDKKTEATKYKTNYAQNAQWTSHGYLNLLCTYAFCQTVKGDLFCNRSVSFVGS